MKELIRTCVFKPYRKGMGPVFTLHLYDTGRVSRDGKPRLAYELKSKGKIIFEGDDYYCSPLHSIDSDESVNGIMGFLTLRPGDTDSDYFADYTPEQLEFCSLHAESLSFTVTERFGEY